MKNTGALGELKLTSADVSVVVQGTVSQQTARTLTSARQHLPEAEIVLSTWEGADTSGLSYDKLVVSADPGQDGLIRRFPFPHANNVNRQIISTREGIKTTSRDYCLKLRSDMEVSSSGFIDVYRHFCDVDRSKTPLQQRIMLDGLTTSLRFPMAIGDWWFFGRKDDLALLFDVSPYEAATRDGLEYFEQRQLWTQRPLLQTVIARYSPEQYIAHGLASKFLKYTFNDYYDSRPEVMKASRTLILGSFLPAEPEISGIHLPKAANIAGAASYHNALPLLSWLRERGIEAALPDALADQSRCVAMMKQYRDNALIENKRAELDTDKNFSSTDGLVAARDCTPVQAQEVTFVVAGRLSRIGEFDIRATLGDIRRYFPESRIVLSTWTNTDVVGLDGLFDDIVFSDPILNAPDAYVSYAHERKINSVSMQQLLMKVGLDRVQTRYAVRFRPDFRLKNGNLLQFYNVWRALLPTMRPEFEVFSDRVLIPRVVTRNPRRDHGHFVHHPSDIFQIGLLEDLKKLWTGEPMPREIAEFFDDNPDSDFPNPALFNHLYTAEQFPWLKLLARQRPEFIQPRHYSDNLPDRLTFETEALFASNFIVASQNQIGLTSKFKEETDFQWSVFYTFPDFLETYLRYVDPHNEAVEKHYWLSFLTHLVLTRDHAYRPAVQHSALRNLDDLSRDIDTAALINQQYPDASLNPFGDILFQPRWKRFLFIAFRHRRSWLKWSVLAGFRLIKQPLPKIVRRAIRSISSKMINILTVIRDNAV